MRDTWKFTCVGRVVGVADLSTDKTGRDERGVTTLTVRPEEISVDVEGVSFGETLDVQMDRNRMAHKLGRAPVVGDRVEVAGAGTGTRPVRAHIDKIKLAATETEA